MVTTATRIDGLHPETQRTELVTEPYVQRWVAWPVNWSAVWVGALANLSAVLLFGLIGIALGAHLLDPEHRIVDLRKIAIGTLAFSIFSSFLAFVIGGWVTGKIAGILHSEPAMLHGVISWLVAVPLLVVVAALGAGNFLGGWYAGLAGTPSWGTATTTPFQRPEPPSSNATDSERTEYRTARENYERKVREWQEDSPKVARNTALGAITALLLGLIGSLIGGWMASGEPMSLTYRRTTSSVSNAHLGHA
jgi:hypothetical protein